MLLQSENTEIVAQAHGALQTMAEIVHNGTDYRYLPIQFSLMEIHGILYVIIQ
jgi:hypothetical protein